MDGVIVPELARHQAADLLLNEAVGVDDAGVEAAVVPDLQGEAGRDHFVAERLALLDGDAHRLFYEDVLAGLERLQRELDMILVCNGYDDGLYLGVGQHIGVASEAAEGAVDG